MRFCNIYPHGKCKNQVKSICTYMNCSRTSKWACEECEKNNLHLHEDNSYLIKIDRLYYNLQRTTPLKMLKNQLLVTKKLVKEFQLLSDSIQQIIQYQEIDKYSILNSSSISKLDDQKLEILLSLIRAYKTYDDIENTIFYTQIQLQNLKFQDIQLEMAPINGSILKGMKRPMISQNEKYLGFIREGADIQNFKLIQMPSNKCFYGKYLKRQRSVVSFFSDSKQVILIGNDHIYSFLIKGLKLIFRKNLNNLQIFDFQWIKNDKFIILDAEGIKNYDLKKRGFKQILEGNLHFNFVYDSYNDLIVAGRDQMIKFYDREQSILRWEHQVNRLLSGRIQIIDQGKKLVIVHEMHISIWEVNHQFSNLTLREELSWPPIMQLRSINSDQMLLCIRLFDRIRITDDKLKIKYELCISSDSMEIQSKNYLLLTFPEFTYQILEIKRMNN